MPVRHEAVAAGGCLACHDAHGNGTPFMLVAATPAQTCAACHAADRGSVPHPPYHDGDCAACHEPHGSEFAMLLRGGEGADHCALCHADTITDMASARHSHAAVEGECLACHDAHVGRAPGLLHDTPGRSCASCHKEVGRTVAAALFSHDAVLEGDQCLACHTPHASDGPMMLRDTLPEVCLGCHADAVAASDGRVIPAMTAALAEAPLLHGPVAEGDCGACHSVHGGSHARLLREINPGVLSGPFDIRNYALCFACHDQALALEELTTSTQFRDGERNLHKAHLATNGRGRGCGDCHAVHSSSHPRLVADRIAYDGSDWTMEMNFVLTQEGGSCSPGCHEPLGYRRGEPAPAPDQEGGAP
jgi:predicted CXXCH cytochrome family protein